MSLSLLKFYINRLPLLRNDKSKFFRSGPVSEMTVTTYCDCPPTDVRDETVNSKHLPSSFIYIIPATTPGTVFLRLITLINDALQFVDYTLYNCVTLFLYSAFVSGVTSAPSSCGLLWRCCRAWRRWFSSQFRSCWSLCGSGGGGFGCRR